MRCACSEGQLGRTATCVLRSIRGTPSPTASYNAFIQSTAQAGVRRIPFDSLRHTHATMLLLQNVPAKIVSERLGHSTIAITLNTYSHVLPDMQDAAVGRLEELLSETR